MATHGINLLYHSCSGYIGYILPLQGGITYTYIYIYHGEANLQRHRHEYISDIHSIKSFKFSLFTQAMSTLLSRGPKILLKISNTKTLEETWLNWQYSLLPKKAYRWNWINKWYNCNAMIIIQNDEWILTGEIG